MLLINVAVQFGSGLAVDLVGHIYEDRVVGLSIFQSFANRYKYETGFVCLLQLCLLPPLCAQLLRLVSGQRYCVQHSPACTSDVCFSPSASHFCFLCCPPQGFCVTKDDSGLLLMDFCLHYGIKSVS